MTIGWPKKLQTKFLLGLTGITFAGGLLFAAALYSHMRALVESEASSKAKLVLAQAQSVQQYVRSMLRPAMYELLPEDEFILETMSSSYISRSIMQNAQLEDSDYSYRRVAIDARNPDFEATPREVRLIGLFQEDPEKQQWSGFETFGGREYFCTVLPVRIEKSCLNCHGSPDKAPAQLIERYGAERGFNRSPGEIVGVSEVLVPLSRAMIDVRGATIGSVSFSIAGALFCFAVANVLFNRLVVYNLRRVALVFPKYFHERAESSVLERVGHGNEIDEVMHGVEDLARNLSEAQDKLEDYAQNLKQMVDERTADLAREAGDRRSDVQLFVRLLRVLNQSHARRQLIENTLPLICRRYDVAQAAFVCTFATQNFYSWPEPEKRPPLPENWQELITEGKPLFLADCAYIPVQPQHDVVEGLLCLFWKPATFDPERVGDVLIALGRQLGVAMENLNFQDRLLQQNAMLQSIFEGISDPLLLMDRNATVLMANKAAFALSEAEEPSLAENTVSGIVSLFGPHLVETVAPALCTAIDDGAPVSFELRMQQERSFIVSIYPLRGNNGSGEEKRGRAVVYARENTSEKRMLAKIQQHEKQITVGRMAAGLAHEINNPLGVILTYAELLQTTCTREQECDDVGVIIDHTRKAQKVLQDLLNFARPKRMTDSLCDPEEVIRNVAAVFNVQAERRNALLEIDVNPDLPPVDCDPMALEQILSNLLLNALDAAPDEEGRILLSAKAVSETLPGFHGQRTMLHVRVVDNGSGIPPEDAGRIFDPFFSTKDVGKGTGLGLAVVYGLVQELGGRIDVDNNDPKYGGAAFSLLLPAQETPGSVRLEVAAGAGEEP